MNAKTHGTLATACLAALIVTLYKVSLVLGALNSWQAYDQPKVAGELMQAVVFGLVALALGLGLNVGTVLRGLGIPIGAPSTEADKEQTT
jgi:hypothetical protein